VASAVEATLIDSLKSLPSVASVRPYLMAAFNARRERFSGRAWFVLQEPGRLTFALVEEGGWKLIRSRRAPEPWTEVLGDLLDREIAADASLECDTALVFAESEAPSSLGRYAVSDITLAKGAISAARACAMVLQ
jgi:hypothetical protein